MSGIEGIDGNSRTTQKLIIRIKTHLVKEKRCLSCLTSLGKNLGGLSYILVLMALQK